MGIIRIILENKLDIDLDYLIDLPESNFDKPSLQRFLRERIVYYLTEKSFQKKGVKTVVEHYKLDFLPVLPSVIAEINEFISSDSGVRVLAVYKRVSNFLSSSKEILGCEKEYFEEGAAEEDKLVQKQLMLTKEQVEGSLKRKDFKTALVELNSMVDSVNQFLDNVQINCEDNALRILRYSFLNQIRETMDRVVVLSELDKK